MSSTETDHGLTQQAHDEKRWANIQSSPEFIDEYHRILSEIVETVRKHQMPSIGQAMRWLAYAEERHG